MAPGTLKILRNFPRISPEVPLTSGRQCARKKVSASDLKILNYICPISIRDKICVLSFAVIIKHQAHKQGPHTRQAMPRAHASVSRPHALRRTRTRHGEGFAPARAGPQSLEDILNWPTRLADVFIRGGRGACDGEDHASNFLHNFTQLGISIGTLYSGMLTPEIGMHYMCEALAGTSPW